MYTFPLLAMWGQDFRAWVEMYRHIHTAAFMTTGPHLFLYPPAAAPLQWIFSVLPQPTLSFYAGVACVLLATAACSYRALQREGVSRGEAAGFVTLLLLGSYPLAFCLRQGNIEIFVFALIAVAVWSFCRGRMTAAAVCLGIVGAAKIYPFFLLALFVSARRWKAIAAALMTALVATGASLWLIHPNLRVAVHEVSLGLAQASDLQFFRQNTLQGGFDHSLLGVYKRLARTIPSPEQMHSVVRWYVAGLGTLGLALYFGRLRRLPWVNQVLGLTVAAITFVPLSYDYTLLHLYVPLGMVLLQLQRRAARLPGRVVVLLGAFVVAMAPWSELIFHGATVACLPRGVGLMTLLALSVAGPLFEEGTSTVDEMPERGRATALRGVTN